MRHETRSHGTTASRRLLEDGGAPHPWLIAHIPAFLMKMASFTPLFFQCGSFVRSLTPSQSIVWLLHMTWSVSANWWISIRDSLLLALYISPLLVVSSPSYVSFASSQISYQSLLCAPWSNLCLELSSLLLWRSRQIFCPLGGPKAYEVSCMVLLQWLSHVF